MRTLIKKPIILIVLGSLQLNCIAQSNEIPNINNQLWIDFYPSFEINNKLGYYGDMGFRTIVGETSWNRIYIRPSIRYNTSSKTQLRGGISLMYIYDRYDLNRFEFTPWQAIQYKMQITAKWYLKHRLRLEERFSYLLPEWNSSFDLRIRYKISGELQFKNEWYSPYYAEVFIPVNDEIEEYFRNRARTGVGIGKSLSKNWKLELLFNIQTSRIDNNDNLNITDRALQLKIKKKIIKNEKHP